LKGQTGRWWQLGFICVATRQLPKPKPEQIEKQKHLQPKQAANTHQAGPKVSFPALLTASADMVLLDNLFSLASIFISCLQNKLCVWFFEFD
jgi:hypothetical protein